MHDVAVAGGSLAGVAAALHLARRGRRVVLLEKALQPRPKACGEGLFPAGVRELRALGLLPAVADCSAPLRGVAFHAGGHSVAAPLGPDGSDGLGLRRATLAPLLLRAAREAGVEVRTGVAVTGLLSAGGRLRAFATNDGPVEARAFVGADGLGSRVRRLAGLDAGRRGERYGVSFHVALPAPADHVHVFFEQGYELYLTPVSPASPRPAANVALLMRRPELAAMRGRLEAAVDGLLATHPALAGATREDRVLVAGPFAASCSRAWRANLLLAGDAAGFFDGITGEGMSAALAMGRLAAVALDTHLCEGSYAPMREYERARRQLVRNSTLLARLTLALGRAPWSAAVAVRNLERRPGTFARLVAINSGEAPLSALRPRDLAALAFAR